MAEVIVDVPVKHPPTWPIDPEYAREYEVWLIAHLEKRATSIRLYEKNEAYL